MKWWNLGTMILLLWMLHFKSAFSLSSFTFIKRLFSSSSHSAIRVVSFAQNSCWMAVTIREAGSHAQVWPQQERGGWVWRCGLYRQSLGVGTGVECPENTLGGLMWHCNQNSVNTRSQRKTNKLSHRKALTLHCDPWCTHRMKNHILVNTKGEQGCCLLWLSLFGAREVGVWQPEVEGKGPLLYQPQRPHFPPSWEQASSH